MRLVVGSKEQGQVAPGLHEGQRQFNGAFAIADDAERFFRVAVAEGNEVEAIGKPFKRALSNWNSASCIPDGLDQTLSAIFLFFNSDSGCVSGACCHSGISTALGRRSSGANGWMRVIGGCPMPGWGSMTKAMWYFISRELKVKKERLVFAW